MTVGFHFCIFSKVPEFTAALIAQAAVKQLKESDLSDYRQEGSEDSRKKMHVFIITCTLTNGFLVILIFALD